jgi:hypothetical protein
MLTAFIGCSLGHARSRSRTFVRPLAMPWKCVIRSLTTYDSLVLLKCIPVVFIRQRIIFCYKYALHNDIFLLAGANRVGKDACLCASAYE